MKVDLYGKEKFKTNVVIPTYLVSITEQRWRAFSLLSFTNANSSHKIIENITLDLKKASTTLALIHIWVNIMLNIQKPFIELCLLDFKNSKEIWKK